MPQEELKKNLASLHEELARSPSVDPELRVLLARLAEDIDDVLHPAAPPPETTENDSLVDRVKHAAEHFEESHPQLAALIGRMAESLSQLGI
ncbi:MAG: DUF4404 family protein [Planctomycetota bacterium]|nr:MAG: DUF4404 family protein [Planctomycetota bacterium]REJ89256.1 MAG: DUF4404 family protein [Planctomycetota bacterium]REK29319.1 MAG: DUF4404 family protein [Planctomycetota bacterium]REK35946.1 MAG: DUF4404 family protein [Planctomycetota bacterium]